MKCKIKFHEIYIWSSFFFLKIMYFLLFKLDNVFVLSKCMFSFSFPLSRDLQSSNNVKVCNFDIDWEQICTDQDTTQYKSHSHGNLKQFCGQVLVWPGKSWKMFCRFFSGFMKSLLYSFTNLGANPETGSSLTLDFSWKCQNNWYLIAK